MDLIKHTLIDGNNKNIILGEHKRVCNLKMVALQNRMKWTGGANYAHLNWSSQKTNQRLLYSKKLKKLPKLLCIGILSNSYARKWHHHSFTKVEGDIMPKSTIILSFSNFH